MKQPLPSILFAGPMLGRHPGWVPNPSEELAPRLAERGYSCRLVSDKLNRFHRLGDTLAAVVRYRGQTDILCLQVYSGSGFVNAEMTSLLAKWLELPVVMVLHGGGIPDLVKQDPQRTRRVFERAGAIVAPSAYLAQAVHSIGFEAQIIPNAIELAQYPFRQRTSPSPTLLWMRTFHDVYNPLLAVEAFNLVKKQYPHARLTMAGQDKGLLGMVVRRVHELGLSASVRFTGFLNSQDKQREFAGHDIFLNTNRVDNMPVSVVEAAAFGIPIVATAVGGLPYMINDGENGLLTTDNDSTSMASAVERILTEPGLASHLSQSARQEAEHYGWHNILPKWETLFEEVGISRHNLLSQLVSDISS